MRTRRSKSTVRPGSMFVEAVIAMTIVLVAMASAAQLIAICVRQRREVEQLRIATIEAANVMERLYSSPWSELMDRTGDWPNISQAAIDSLDEALVRISIETTDGVIASKRCRVEVSWIDHAGQRVEPIQLTAWRHNGKTP